MADRLARRAGTLAGVGLAVVFAAVVALDAGGIAVNGGNWAFEAGTGVIVCVTALVRGRSRVWAAGVGLAACGAAAVIAGTGHLPSQPGPAATLGLLVLGAAAIRILAVRPATILAVAGVVVLAGAGLAQSRVNAESRAILGVFWWGAALGVGLWMRYRDGRRRAGVEAVRRDERLELARELHDVVAHHITGIVLQAQGARLVATKRPETLEATLAGIETAGTDALAAMRRVVRLLRDAEDAGGLTPGPEQLTELVERFAAHGPPVALHLPSEPTGRPWPPEVTTTVYRVVQEALTNIVRHAPDARSVTVNVIDDQSGVTVEILDDAPPAPSRFPPGGGYGLIGMRERVEALGGTLCAGYQSGAGWLVRATLPAGTGTST